VEKPRLWKTTTGAEALVTSVRVMLGLGKVQNEPAQNNPSQSSESTSIKITDFVSRT
jgi:hypothetical protein